MADRTWTAHYPINSSPYWGLAETATLCRHGSSWVLAGQRWSDHAHVVLSSADLVTWTLVTAAPAWAPASGYSSHTGPALASLGGNLYYFPQHDGDLPAGGAGVYVSEDDGETWSLLAETPLGGKAPCGWSRAAVWGGGLALTVGYVCSTGPYSRSTVREFWQSVDAGATWSRLSAGGEWDADDGERSLFIGPAGALCIFSRDTEDEDVPCLFAWDETYQRWDKTALLMAAGESVDQDTLDEAELYGGGVWHNGNFYVCIYWSTVEGSVVTPHSAVLWSTDGETYKVFESDPPWTYGDPYELLVADGRLVVRTCSDAYVDGYAMFSIYVGTGEGPDGDEDGPGEASEAPWYTFACTPYGSKLNRSDVSHDFNRVLVFDLGKGTLYPGVGYPFACTLSSTSPCAGEGMLPRSLFGGTIDGHIHEILDETAWGLGAPAGLVAWPLAAGCTTTTLYIDVATARQHFPADALIGLSVTVGSESRTVTDNDETSLTVGVAFTAAASAGDTLLVAPMTCGLVWPEQRSAGVHTPASLALDVENDQQYGDGTTIEQSLTADLWVGAGGVLDLDLGTPTLSLTFDTEDLRRGRGAVYLPRRTGRCSALGLRWQPRGNGRLRIGPATLGLAASGTEPGRGG